MEIDIKYLKRMILSNPWMDDKSGKIRFKYYGDFDGMNYMYDDCKDDLIYVGNSNKDGAPVFEYNYSGIALDILTNFNELNILLRKFKILKYKGEELNKKEKSYLTFLMFFMSNVEANQIKGASTFEIIKFENHEKD